jgi:hypothetical protein
VLLIYIIFKLLTSSFWLYLAYPFLSLALCLLLGPSSHTGSGLCHHPVLYSLSGPIPTSHSTILLIRDAKVIVRGEAGETSGHYGQIAKDIVLMLVEHIAFAFGAVTQAGLKTFHPDVFGPAHSTYNQLHRHLAVLTFQSVAGWSGFTSLNVSLTVAQDYHLLSEMYNNFVNGILKTNSRKENNTPRSLSKSITQSSADKCQARVCLYSFFN